MTKPKAFFTLRHLIATAFLFSISSCSTHREKIFPAAASKKLDFANSFVVKSFTDIQIQDYDALKNQYLAYETGSKRILLLDKTGAIIQSKFLIGAGPDEVGQAISKISFATEGNILVKSNKGISYLNNNLQLKKTHKLNITGWPSSLSYLDEPLSASTIGSKLLILDTDLFRQPMRSYNEDFFSKLTLASLYEVSSESIGLVSKTTFDEIQTIYNNEKIFFNDFIPILSSNKESSEFFMSLPNEPSVYKLDQPTGRWETYLENLNLDGFNEPKGIEFDQQNKNLKPGFGINDLEIVYGISNPRILKLFPGNKRFGILYRTGLPTSLLPKNSDKIYSIREKHQKIIFCLFEEGRKILSVEIENMENHKNSIFINEDTLIFQKKKVGNKESQETTFLIYSVS